ncbi:YkgJ family cysteine cluster protein [Halorubrum vacuolatum]|uniref:Uncharacterized protein n=1 Tax=Halorubrum vacuolatum TaxID=63740 RepID=A0A238XVX8_HALVU|nr:YkgJ family cysteine cluster protein [Halorubrum vacuolatum]SNR63206.1 hypothetical protein SAMN06264855_12431 [Halorubrum vacuolatum]
MKLRCAGCAGCCVDWRPIAPDASETRGSNVGGRRPDDRRPPLDDVANLAPLTRDEVVRYLDRGVADALIPRLFEPAERDEVVTIDGVALAAVDGRPVFMIGLYKPPKPVAPVGTETVRWLDTCVFLDPTTLQCRIHGDEDLYPRTCATYPAHNLALDAETECERVEAAGGGERLLDPNVPDDIPPPAFGPHALGATIFAYPDPDDLAGVVDRLRRGESTFDDRARFIGAAVGSRPGSLSVDRDRMGAAHERVRGADSWAGRAIRSWTERAGKRGEPAAVADTERDALVGELEDEAGAPGTPGWQ